MHTCTQIQCMFASCWWQRWLIYIVHEKIVFFACIKLGMFYLSIFWMIIQRLQENAFHYLLLNDIIHLHDIRMFQFWSKVSDQILYIFHLFQCWLHVSLPKWLHEILTWIMDNWSKFRADNWLPFKQKDMLT